jgi:hypothetical protein
MKNVQFIEGANYCENPSMKKGDLFANHLRVNGKGNSMNGGAKKKHRRKKETIQHLNDVLRYEQLKKELSYETNRTTQKV